MSGRSLYSVAIDVGSEGGQPIHLTITSKFAMSFRTKYKTNSYPAMDRVHTLHTTQSSTTPLIDVLTLKVYINSSVLSLDALINCVVIKECMHMQSISKQALKPKITTIP